MAVHNFSDRVKMRIACEVSMGVRRHSGLVLNVSPGGLFVQTHARSNSGDAIRVVLNVPRRSEAMALDATVVWKRAVPAGLLPLAQGGVGLSLLNPPEGYLRFLADAVRPHEQPLNITIAGEPILDSASQVAGDDQASGPVESYKVRVGLGQRSRILTVSAISDAHAREVALECAGKGWKVIASERCC